MRKNIKIISLLLIALSLVFILTFPLMLNIKGYIPAFESTDEPFGALQIFWWMKYSFTHELSWMNEQVIAYPFGVQHKPISIIPLWLYIGKFLSLMTNQVVAYNLLLIFNLCVSFIAMYYLVFYLTGNTLAGIFSGMIFAFCPYQMTRFWQHFSLTFSQWMPLYLLGLFKLYQYGRKRDVLLCVCAFFLLLVFDFHYVFFMSVATLFFIAYVLIVRRHYKGAVTLKACILTIVLILIISLVLLFPFLKQVLLTAKTATPSAYSNIVRPFDDLFMQSARPLSYFLPAVMHPIFGKFTTQLLGTSLYGMSITEHTLYLGWTPLILAFFVFRRWRKRKLESTGRDNFYIGFFLLLVLVAWIFSQPPWWKIGPIKILMPSFFIYKILPMFRAYCRFGILLMLAIAVLAGFGLKFIIDKFKPQRAKLALTCLFSGLVLFEFWNYPPFKVIDVSGIPQAYSWLREQPQNTVIAEYPIDWNGANVMYMFYQTKHEKKMINGTVPGTMANNLAKSIVRVSDPHTAGILSWMGVRYVLVHKENYLDSGLAQDKEELKEISSNLSLKLVKSFPSQGCSRRGIRCVQEIGPIDVYEVKAKPVEPKIKE